MSKNGEAIQVLAQELFNIGCALESMTARQQDIKQYVDEYNENEQIIAKWIKAKESISKTISLLKGE